MDPHGHPGDPHQRSRYDEEAGEKAIPKGEGPDAHEEEGG
jgi:hypothetical protein